MSTITYDEWRGSMDGRPTLWVKHLFCRRGWHIDLHKMVAADDPECFHTHPAYAIRIVLWGGYVEETEREPVRYKTWWPGKIGIVRPDYSHRIDRLRNGRWSCSLWIRFRKVAKVELRGNGWAKQEQIYRAPNTTIEQPHAEGK